VSGSLWVWSNQNLRVVKSLSIVDQYSGQHVHPRALAKCLSGYRWSVNNLGSIRDYRQQEGQHWQQCWEHLESPVTNLESFQIPQEQPGKYMFSWNNAGAPGHYGYYIKFKNNYNSCILFVFRSMYLSIYVLMYCYSYLSTFSISGPVADELESNSRCTWRWQWSELEGTLLIHDWGRLQMHWVRPSSCELGDLKQACLEILLEAIMVWTSRFTPSLRLCKFGDAPGGHDQSGIGGILGRSQWYACWVRSVNSYIS